LLVIEVIDGNSINIWKHPWLRNDEYTHVTTTMMAGREEMRVAELVMKVQARGILSLSNKCLIIEMRQRLLECL
jgi:hypothetical protein